MRVNVDDIVKGSYRILAETSAVRMKT